MQAALEQHSPPSSSEDESDNELTDVERQDDESPRFMYYRLQQSDELYYDAARDTYVARVPPLLLLCVDHYAELLIRSAPVLSDLPCSTVTVLTNCVLYYDF